MAVTITRQQDDFLLDGANDHRLRLVINCRAQLARYNSQPNAHADFELYRRFADAVDESTLDAAINELYQVYMRQNFGRRVLQPSEIAPHLQEIRQEPPVAPNDGNSINAICDRLEYWRKTLDLSPSSTISLSKLLHFLKPDSFWIVDSRVMTVLRMWGFEQSYRGFGELLRTLCTHPEWPNLQEFLRTNDSDPQNRQGWNHPPCSALKLLDKVLWW